MAPLVASCGGGGTDPKPKVATKLALVTEPSATAQTLEPLAVQPVVQVTDDAGEALPTSTTVTAEVLDGNGAITAGGTATTDATGRATFAGLTLGAKSGAVGAVTLRFTAPGLSPVSAPVTLQCPVRATTFGQSVNGALQQGMCGFSDGRIYNTYEVTTSQPLTAVRFTERATFRSLLGFRGPNEPAAFFRGTFADAANEELVVRALLPQGRSEILVAGFDAGSTGTYSLTVAGEPSVDLTCESPFRWAGTPITTSQRLGGTGDCFESGFYRDYLRVGIPVNATITATMTSVASATSPAFQPALSLLRGTNDVVVATAAATAPATTATLTFTNTTASGGYSLRLSSSGAGTVGDYTISINVSNPGTAVAAGRPGGLIVVPAGDR